MKNIIKYKDYIGSIEYSEEDNILFGKVQGIRALISYEGITPKDLINDFHAAVEDYLELCRDKKIEPEKSFKGSFNVRISPELHREIAVKAMQENISLNSFVEKALLAAIN